MDRTVAAIDDGSQEERSSRPSVLVVGPRDVGKRSLVRRLVRGARSASGSIPGDVVTSHRWSIDTKYYTADVNLWVSHCEDSSNDAPSAQALVDGCDALVLVFDLSEDASFSRVSQWASTVDLTAFEVLLCVANKADLLPDHHAHETLAQERPLQSEQRERLVDDEDSSPLSFGFQSTSAAKALDVRRQEYSAWCLENGVEYIETCALDEHFDQRISVDGDMQGIPRLRSALHAHMWPGMILKPKPGSGKPVRSLSDGEASDFSIEYELLEADGARGVAVRDVSADGFSDGVSDGSADGVVGGFVVDGEALGSRELGLVEGEESAKGGNERSSVGGEQQERSEEGATEAGSSQAKEGGEEAPLDGGSDLRREGEAGASNGNGKPDVNGADKDSSAASTARLDASVEGPAGSTQSNGDPKKSDGVSKRSDGNGPLHLDEAAAMREVEHEGDSEYAEMERIMHEVASARDRLSGLPDVVRREEAARYAMRMMQMLGDEESDIEAD